MCGVRDLKRKGFDNVAFGVCEGQKKKFWLMRWCAKNLV